MLFELYHLFTQYLKKILFIFFHKFSKWDLAYFTVWRMRLWRDVPEEFICMLAFLLDTEKFPRALIIEIFIKIKY